MSKQKYNSSKLLTICLLESAISLLILIAEPDITHIKTVAFAMLSVGSLLSVLIYNHVNNPIATDKSIMNMSYAFVIYSGICTWIVHNEIVQVERMLIPLSIVLVSSLLIPLVPKMFDIQKSDI